MRLKIDRKTLNETTLNERRRKAFKVLLLYYQSTLTSMKPYFHEVTHR